MESADQQHSRNILLVHGAIADGSIWRHVMQSLQRNNFTVVASQRPLTSFTDDVKAVKRDLGTMHGTTVVVGHSYGGAVVTQAAAGASNVVSLVYIAAIVPDTGESVHSLLTQYSPSVSAQYFVPVDPNETPPFLSSNVTSSHTLPAMMWNQARPRRRPPRKGQPQPPATPPQSRESQPGNSSRRGTKSALMTDHSTPPSKRQ